MLKLKTILKEPFNKKSYYLRKKKLLPCFKNKNKSLRIIRFLKYVEMKKDLYKNICVIYFN